MRRLLTRYIGVHHSADLGGNELDLPIDDAVRRIKNGHVRSGLAYDGDPAYHVIVSGNKGMALTRPFNKVGYHAGNWYHNIQSLAICLVGNFQRYEPTNYQKTKVGEQLLQWMNDYNIPRSRILLHLKMRPTLCPGLHVNDSWITEAIAEARNRKINFPKLFEEVWGIKPAFGDWRYFDIRYRRGDYESYAHLLRNMRYWHGIVYPWNPRTLRQEFSEAGNRAWQATKEQILR